MVTADEALFLGIRLVAIEAADRVRPHSHVYILNPHELRAAMT